MVEKIAVKVPKLSNKTNGYIIKSIEAYNSNEKFGIEIGFERNYVSQSAILINYHLICAMLVLVASINFVFNAKDTNRSCILVALLLVLATFFSDAQVIVIKIRIEYILVKYPKEERVLL